jgi:lysozyme
MSEDPLADAILLIRPIVQAFEGLHRKLPDGRIGPYLCPARVWTIGYGATHYADGRPVQPDDPPISVETAERLLTMMLPAYARQALQASPHLIQWPRRLAAITDFVFNCGLPRYRSSTLRRRVDEEDWEGAYDEMLKWTRGGGRVLPGLVRRRAVVAPLLS